MADNSWDDHPTVLSGVHRSFGEKAADALRLGMGSWFFFIFFLLILLLWIVSGGLGADPNPYFRLNLILSMLAGLQGSALLISDKRADRIRAEVARHHLEVSEEIHRLLKEMHELTKYHEKEDPNE
jgi:hypothetical protein